MRNCVCTFNKGWYGESGDLISVNRRRVTLTHNLGRRPTPLMMKSADKPGSVVDSHSSDAVTAALKQPTRTQRGPPLGPYLVLLGGVTVPRTVARRAVRSYHTLSPYRPLGLFQGLRRSTLCCTFRRLAPPGVTGTHPMEPGLSSLAAFASTLAATVCQLRQPACQRLRSPQC